MTSSSVDDISKRPVRIRVCRDEHRVAILVSDEAGGIPFEAGPDCFATVRCKVRALVVGS